ncbi:MAG TPA: 50S ribosomal protein L6 [Stellaceae bacterium]|nr:50S ribosomal protein L6 [Stellaceae bacterium]
MSRVGKHPVQIPQGVNVEVAGHTVTAKGKLGTLKLVVGSEIDAAVKDGKVVVTPKSESPSARMQWGSARANINNMVNGVSKGFSVSLEINGVGYRAAVQGKTLNLQLGFSHDVEFPIPEGIKIVCEKPTSIQISGADRQAVGEVAAKIRSYRKPEPYKGKGIKYVDEKIRRKEGKKK